MLTSLYGGRHTHHTTTDTQRVPRSSYTLYDNRHTITKGLKRFLETIGMRGTNRIKNINSTS